MHLLVLLKRNLLLAYAISHNSFAHIMHELATEILCFHKCLGNPVLLQICIEMKLCRRNNVFNKTCVTCSNKTGKAFDINAGECAKGNGNRVK